MPRTMGQRLQSKLLLRQAQVPPVQVRPQQWAAPISSWRPTSFSARSKSRPSPAATAWMRPEEPVSGERVQQFVPVLSQRQKWSPPRNTRRRGYWYALKPPKAVQDTKARHANAGWTRSITSLVKNVYSKSIIRFLCCLTASTELSGAASASGPLRRRIYSASRCRSRYDVERRGEQRCGDAERQPK
jgi:hypothetical protein